MKPTTINRRTVIGNRPYDAPTGHIVVNAPRPLLGIRLDYDPFMWYAVDPHDPDVLSKLEYNSRMDCLVIDFLTKNYVRQNIGQERARLTEKYGTEAVAELDDDDIFDNAMLKYPSEITAVPILDLLIEFRSALPTYAGKLVIQREDLVPGHDYLYRLPIWNYDMWGRFTLKESGGQLVCIPWDSHREGFPLGEIPSEYMFCKPDTAA